MVVLALGLRRSIASGADARVANHVAWACDSDAGCLHACTVDTNLPRRAGLCAVKRVTRSKRASFARGAIDIDAGARDALPIDAYAGAAVETGAARRIALPGGAGMIHITANVRTGIGDAVSIQANHVARTLPVITVFGIATAVAADLTGFAADPEAGVEHADPIHAYKTIITSAVRTARKAVGGRGAATRKLSGKPDGEQCSKR